MKVIDHAKILELQREKRLKILAKTDGLCWYCGERLTYVEGAPVKEMDFTIDHVKPVAHGGGNEMENLVPACKRCNSAKGDLTLDEFRRDFAHGALALRRGQLIYLKNLGIDVTLYERKGRDCRFFGEALDWGVETLQKAAQKIMQKRRAS